MRFSTRIFLSLVLFAGVYATDLRGGDLVLGVPCPVKTGLAVEAALQSDLQNGLVGLQQLVKSTLQASLGEIFGEGDADMLLEIGRKILGCEVAMLGYRFQPQGLVQVFGNVFKGGRQDLRLVLRVGQTVVGMEPVQIGDQLDQLRIQNVFVGYC